jgi:transcriptional regulator with XRE-family HTH domain
VGDAAAEDTSIGELVRRYRRQAGLTQEELGERAELSVRAVRNLEHGRVRRPRRGTIRRLTSALMLDAEQEACLLSAARGVPPFSEPNRDWWYR